MKWLCGGGYCEPLGSWSWGGGVREGSHVWRISSIVRCRDATEARR